jgi:DNA-binding XRE family transcriptional regulator
MSGFIPRPILRVLRREFGKKLTVTPDKTGEELESVFGTEEYNEFKKRVSPADYVRTYRENAGLTQAELAEKLGVTRGYICDIEHNRRDFSKHFARQVADFFGFSIAHLL